MTLIAYVRCKDGTVLASDKKETYISDVGQIVRKYYLSTDREFVLAMAGDSIRIDMIVSELSRNKDITSITAVDRLHEIIEKTKIENVESMASGLLLVRDNDELKFNDVWCSGHNHSITKQDPLFRHYGDGSYLADYLIRELDLASLSWNEVCPRLVAIMDAVAERVDSVGKINDHGIDLLVFTDGGLLKTTVSSTDKIGRIECTYDIGDGSELELTTVISKGITKKNETIHSTIESSGRDYGLEWQISGGEITSIELFNDTNSLLISLSTVSDGELTVVIPRTLIDSMIGPHNAEFYTLCDDEPIYAYETVAEKNRIVTIPFKAGCRKIEIIGSELLGRHTEPEYETNGYDAEKIDRQARERNAPIAVQTDKSTYAYGSGIIVTITNPYFDPDMSITLRITNDVGDAVYESEIPVSEVEMGIYQETVSVKGRHWLEPGARFRISAEYLGMEAHTHVTTVHSGMSIELDQGVYSWTSIVYLTVTVPDLIKKSKKVGRIDGTSGYIIQISTSQGVLDEYILVETGIGSGIFTGKIRLTGFPSHDAYGDKRETLINGETGGSGPTDGRIGCFRKDTLTVALFTPTGIVSSSASIRWNVGKIQWLEAVYPPSGTGELRVVDRDMSLDSKKMNEVEVRVWSDSDPNGIQLRMQETGCTTGIFNGSVFFTKEQSSSPSLRVSKGDRVTAEYNDRTLPEPHPIDSGLAISSTSLIGNRVPQLEKVFVENVRIFDMQGNPVEEIVVDQKVQIAADLTNTQEIEQRFAYIIQVRDPNGIRMIPFSTSGLLFPRQSLTSSLTWKPTSSGVYTATIFVWESIENPMPLSPQLEAEIVVEDANARYRHERNPKDMTDAGAKRYPSRPIIHIPLGSSMSGCEKNNRCYDPHSITIRVNKIAIWINDDNAAHSITSGTINGGHDGNFDSGLIVPGASFAHKFVKKGKYPYFCPLHPWQKGVVLVE